MTLSEAGVTPGVELLQRSFEALNRGDLDASVEALAPEFIANLPGAPEPSRGRDLWKQNTQMFLDAFPDLHVSIDDIFGVGDKVAVRLSFQGTHRGDFLGIPSTGRQVSFTSIELYRVSDDVLAEEWVSPDINALLGQIS